MKYMHFGRQRKAANERGVVSIMVVMVLMIVISLIVLGFAEISRRNQRVTLDQELSTQAFYAAESGVNDAAKLINSTIAAGGTVYPKPSCATPANPAAAIFYGNLPSSTIDAGHNVSYSCLMVNPTPNSLTYTDVGMTSTIIPLTTSTGLPYSTVTFTWKTKTNSATPLTGCPGSTTKALSTTNAWGSSGCGYGVLRFDLVPTNSASMTAGSLSANDMTAFVVPVQSGGVASVPFAASGANNNDLIAGSCTNTQCTLTITGLSSNQYYARLMSFYEDVSVIVTGTDSSGSTTNNVGAQIAIDATGKAQDVLRRIEVRVSDSSASSAGSTSSTGAGSGTQLPDFPLESTTSICKRFATMQNYFQNNATTSDGGGNQLCS